MKDKTAQFFTAMLIWSLLLLLVSGCGGSSNDKKAGSFIPSKQNSVDAVLQQKKAEADRQNGNVNAGKETADKQKDAGDITGREAPGIQNKQGADGPVTAQKMKELEEKTPRHDVYDLHPTYKKVDYDFSRMDKTMMYTQSRGPSAIIMTKKRENIISAVWLWMRRPAVLPVWNFPGKESTSIRKIIRNRMSRSS